MRIRPRDPILAGAMISIFVILGMLAWGIQVNNDLATVLRAQGRELKRVADTDRLLIEALARDSAGRDQTMEESHARLVAYVKCVTLLRRPTSRRLDQCAERGGFVPASRNPPRSGSTGQPPGSPEPSPSPAPSPTPTPTPSPSPSPCPLPPPFRCP